MAIFPPSPGTLVIVYPKVNSAHRSTQLSGKVVDIETAFAVKLHRYELDGETYRSYDGYIHIPRELSGIVEAVCGLDRDVIIGNGSNSPTSNPPLYNTVDTEVALDILNACSTAQGANIVVYFGTDDSRSFVDTFICAIMDAVNNPSVLSVSWATPEDGNIITKMDMVHLDSWFKSAGLLGITILCSSGDLGSNNGQNDGKAHVMFPACSPWVTACGGTILSNVTATSFIEHTWNSSGISYGATGGGISTIFGVPEYQQYVVQNNRAAITSVNDGISIGRGVPDIAGNAVGYQITFNSGAGPLPVNGTSAVPPLYAGLIAILNANLGQRVGFLNHMLYELAHAGTTNYVFKSLFLTTLLMASAIRLTVRQDIPPHKDGMPARD